MPVRFINTSGNQYDVGVIRMKNGKFLEWMSFNGVEIPRLPFGTQIKITITYEERDFMSGEEGIVWATYDQHQAETIQNALHAQQISGEIHTTKMGRWRLYLLSIPNLPDVEKAIDFIWRDNTGMRLEPDWWYPANGENKSYNKWINGGSV